MAIQRVNQYMIWQKGSITSSHIGTAEKDLLVWLYSTAGVDMEKQYLIHVHNVHDYSLIVLYITIAAAGTVTTVNEDLLHKLWSLDVLFNLLLRHLTFHPQGINKVSPYLNYTHWQRYVFLIFCPPHLCKQAKPWEALQYDSTPHYYLNNKNILDFLDFHLSKDPKRILVKTNFSCAECFWCTCHKKQHCKCRGQILLCANAA